MVKDNMAIEILIYKQLYLQIIRTGIQKELVLRDIIFKI